MIRTRKKKIDEPMSEETIIKKIRSDAEQNAVKIKKEAEQEAKKIKSIATKEAKDHAQQILEKGEETAKNRKKVLISQAHQDMKRKLMNAKEQVIETCFTKAIDHLEQLDDAEYKKIVRHLILKGKEQLFGNCVLLISRDIDKEIAKELDISIAGETSATGGIVLVSETKDITIDNTFEGILTREKQQLRVQVGKHLFS